MNKLCRVINYFVIFAISLLLFSCAEGMDGDISLYNINNNDPDKARIIAESVESYKAADNLWDELRDDFNLDHYSSRPEVQRQIYWYMHHKRYFKTIAKRAAPYMYYILHEIKKRDLPAELVLLPIIESEYNPFAYSAVGAAGLWQMMPGTAYGYGLKLNWWYDGRKDIIASTNAALDYLTYLQNFFDGNWILAIAAYDTGEGNVLSAIRHNVKHTRNTTFWSLPLSRETREYIPKLLALATIISDPYTYPVDLPPVKNAPYMARVDVGSQIDLAHAAKLAHMKLKDLIRLNPGYNRWATDPDGPYHLVLPIENVQIFEYNLAKLPESSRVTWNHYKIKPGDTLGSIASKYHTSVNILREVNNIHDNSIRAGKDLIIPVATEKMAALVLGSNKQYFSAKEHDAAMSNKIIHTVQPGDSLWKIAKKYNTKVQSIKFWNKIKRNKDLKPNSKVVIWTRAKRRTKKRSSVVIIYTVRRGDTIGKIARKFNTTVASIRRDNKLKNNTIRLKAKLKIKPGGYNLSSHKNVTIVPKKSIKGYTTYTVKPGDVLSKIAAKYHVTTKDITTLNHLSGSIIKPGDKLRVPVMPSSSA